MEDTERDQECIYNVGFNCFDTGVNYDCTEVLTPSSDFDDILLTLLL